MYVQLLGRDLAYFSLDPGCWSLVGFCSWSYVPGNFLYRTFCIRNRLRSEDIIPCHQFLYIYSSHFAFFSEAAKEHKSKHVNCSKIRMTSEVTPEKGSPRQLLSCAGNKAAKGSKNAPCGILSCGICAQGFTKLLTERPRTNTWIQYSTKNAHPRQHRSRPSSFHLCCLQTSTATVFATVYDHKVQWLVAAFLKNQW